MSRVLLVVLMLMLSFQTVWSAAASACMHEQASAGSAHLGHHEQHHDEVTAETSTGGDQNDLSNADHHHFLSVSPLPHIPALVDVANDGADVLILGSDPYPSASIAALERPPRDPADVHSARLSSMRVPHSL